jgi:hypothetical protein
MKKLAFLLIGVALLAALFPVAVSAYMVSAELIAGGTESAGVVQVWNDTENLYVKYWMKGAQGWCLNQTHLHVATSLDDIPRTKKGSPKPGHFDYQGDHDCVSMFTYTIPLEWEIGTELFIAAHAVVTGPSGEETAWGVRCGDLDSVQFTGPGWAAYMVYPLH